MAGEFQRDTSVARLSGDDDTVRFDTPVRAGWEVGEVSNGGYLLALIGRAMVDAAKRPPLTVTSHFLVPVRPGPAMTTVDVVRSGRRFATVRATLERDGRPLVTALGTFGVADGGGVSKLAGAPPEIEPYEDAVDIADVGEPPYPTLNDRLASRLRHGDDGFRFGSPTGTAELAGWFAFADGGPIDEVALLFAADAFAPPIFNSGLPVGWVPTLELTVHVRAVPSSGPVGAKFVSRFISGGLLDEDGELWDAEGTLVAQSRQLSLVPRA